MSRVRRWIVRAGCLPRWHEAAALLPPHDLLDRIVHEGELIARLVAVLPAEHAPAAVDAVQSLLACALELDGARYATPYNFVRALRQRSVKALPAAQADAVQLLTIHGAKGLEARAVFVMDAEPEAQPAETATLLIDWPVSATRPRRVAFIAAESRCPASLQALLADEQAARQREELNGLYVAMTRAKERLAFSRTPPWHAGPERSWWQRVDGNGHRMAAGVVGGSAWHAAKHGGGGSAAGLACPAHPRCGGGRGRWRQPHASARPCTACSNGRPQALLPMSSTWRLRPPSSIGVADAGAVQSISTRILSSAACAPLFDARALAWAGNEVPMAGVGEQAGQVLRIDRLVCTLGDMPTWWVLDYKLDAAPQLVAAYRDQLAAYRRAVQAVQPGDPVRAAFVSGSGELIEPT